MYFDGIFSWRVLIYTPTPVRRAESKNHFIIFAVIRWIYLHAVLLLEFQILLPQGVDSINHNLDELDLGVSKTMLVGDVIGVS